MPPRFGFRFPVQLRARGAAGVNLHAGGKTSCYTPIADSEGAVIEARPGFYGMTLFTEAGQGKLCQTALSAGQINATAYAVKTASGGLNIVVVNKDPNQNLQLTASLPQTVSSAKLISMTQLSNGASGPNLAATSGVTIQGGAINPDEASLLQQLTSFRRTVRSFPLCPCPQRRSHPDSGLSHRSH